MANTRRNRKNSMMGGTPVPVATPCPPGTKRNNMTKRCYPDYIECEEVGGTWKKNKKECHPPFTKLNNKNNMTTKNVNKKNNLTTTKMEGGKRRRRNMTRRRR